jgi:hypothetical protein
MKEFTTAIDEVLDADEATAKREERIGELYEQFLRATPFDGEPGTAEEEEHVSRLRRRAEEQVADEEDDPHVDFKLDGRVMRAYQPTDGQLAFMIAAMGRGQSNEQRFAGILNLLANTLRQEDQDYLDARLLSRDKKDKNLINQIEAIFEHLMEEWFEDRPTQ